MRAMLIVNGAASTVNGDRERRVAASLRAKMPLEVVRTTRRGDATTAARQAADDRVDVVFCLGGDGTANETARGLLHTDTALAPVPGGSTNVFSRSLGFPGDPEKAAAMALRSLDLQAPTSISLGEIEVAEAARSDHEYADPDRFDHRGRRPFLFHCGGGFDAQVTERVERTPDLKRRFGHLFFAAAAASTWLAHDQASISVECVLTNGQLRGPIENTKFAVASNSDPYSFLASRPLTIARRASLDSPLVSTAATTLAPYAVGRILAGALRRSSSVADAPGVVQVEDVAEIRWRSAAPFAFQADGEPLGRTTDLRLRQTTSALRVVLPPANGAH